MSAGARASVVSLACKRSPRTADHRTPMRLLSPAALGRRPSERRVVSPRADAKFYDVFGRTGPCGAEASRSLRDDQRATSPCAPQLSERRSISQSRRPSGTRVNGFLRTTSGRKAPRKPQVVSLAQAWWLRARSSSCLSAHPPPFALKTELPAGGDTRISSSESRDGRARYRCGDWCGCGWTLGP